MNADTIKPVTLMTAMAIAATAAWADEKMIEISGIDRVAVGSGLDVQVLAGEDFGMRVVGDARAIRRLKWREHGDELVLSLRPRGLEAFSPILWGRSDDLTVFVTLPEVTGVDAAAGADVTVAAVATDRLVLEASSGADLTVDGIDAETVVLDASSGSNLTAEGKCDTVKADASAGSDIFARDLACDSAEAEASSGANIDLTATRLRADVSSGADIDVWGAEEIEADRSSGGEVHRH